MKNKLVIGGLVLAIVAVWVYYGTVIRNNRVALKASSSNAVSLLVRNAKAQNKTAFLKSVVNGLQASSVIKVKRAQAAGVGVDCGGLAQEANAILYRAQAEMAYADTFFGNSAAGSQYLAGVLADLGEQYINVTLEMALGGCMT